MRAFAAVTRRKSLNNRHAIQRNIQKRCLLFIAILLIAGSLGMPAISQDDVIFRNYTPASWEADVVTWTRDTLVQNGIDDLIDVGGATNFDIVVNFNRCITQEDVDSIMFIPGAHILQKVSKYITSILIGNANRALVDSIINREGVAFIELQSIYYPTLDVSLENIQVLDGTGTYGANTVESAFPTVDGSGINIVIMDTGVDDGVHTSLPSVRYIGGYDELAVTPGFANPDDINSHGTHVASIALGGTGLGYSTQGVAPGAGLIDVKCIPGTLNNISNALETIYDNRANWNGTGERVDIINMSFSGGGDADGTEYFNQLVDLAESMGIVTVAAAGNAYPMVGFETPGAATRAITVSAYDDNDDPDTVNSTISTYSNQGPRSDDGDADVIDELKPEVCGPGTDIDAALFNTTNSSIEKSGTSMAAPHVAGLAALILQSRSGMVRNAASVKDVIIRTAQRKGAASAPGSDPTWNDRWGWGHINAYEALNLSTETDLSYPNYPPSPAWASADISTSPWPPQAGSPATVTVQITNNGPNYANDARISFGVHDYTASTYTFYDIGTRIVDLPVGTTPVSITWTPVSAGHMCLRTEIGYGPDTDYTNNTTQKNINVSNSPVYFEIRNTMTEDHAMIVFEAEVIYDGPGTPTYDIDPPEIEMAAEDCPEMIEVNMEIPPDAEPGTVMRLNIAAVIMGDTLGGVTITKTVEDSTCCETPGDVNGDGNLNIGDAVYLITFIFKGGPAPPCPDEGDPNGDCFINIGDAVYLITYIFKGGTPPICAGCAE